MDVIIGGGGSIFTFRPVTKKARAWVDDNVELESWQWLGDIFAVEHRYAVDIVDGMRDAGLEVA